MDPAREIRRTNVRLHKKKKKGIAIPLPVRNKFRLISRKLAAGNFKRQFKTSSKDIIIILHATCIGTYPSFFRVTKYRSYKHVVLRNHQLLLLHSIITITSVLLKKSASTAVQQHPQHQSPRPISSSSSTVTGITKLQSAIQETQPATFYNLYLTH